LEGGPDIAYTAVHIASSVYPDVLVDSGL